MIRGIVGIRQRTNARSRPSRPRFGLTCGRSRSILQASTPRRISRKASGGVLLFWHVLHGAGQATGLPMPAEPRRYNSDQLLPTIPDSLEERGYGG